MQQKRACQHPPAASPKHLATVVATPTSPSDLITHHLCDLPCSNHARCTFRNVTKSPSAAANLALAASSAFLPPTTPGAAQTAGIESMPAIVSISWQQSNFVAAARRAAPSWGSRGSSARGRPMDFVNLQQQQARADVRQTHVHHDWAGLRRLSCPQMRSVLCVRHHNCQPHPKTAASGPYCSGSNTSCYSAGASSKQAVCQIMPRTLHHCQVPQVHAAAPAPSPLLQQEVGPASQSA